MSTFSKTQGINAFASNNNISKIDILKNPKTGKLFGVLSNGDTVRLGKDISALTEDLSVSWFSPEDGEASWMIHKTGSGAETVSSMSFTPKTELSPF